MTEKFCTFHTVLVSNFFSSPQIDRKLKIYSLFIFVRNDRFFRIQSIDKKLNGGLQSKIKWKLYNSYLDFQSNIQSYHTFANFFFFTVSNRCKSWQVKSFTNQEPRGTKNGGDCQTRPHDFLWKFTSNRWFLLWINLTKNGDESKIFDSSVVVNNTLTYTANQLGKSVVSPAVSQKETDLFP